MFRYNSRHVSFAPFATVLVLSMLWNSSAPAQENDPLETLHRIPPDPTLLTEGTITMGKVMLEWQIRRGTMNLDRLETDIQVLQQAIDEKEDALEMITKKPELEEYAFASDTVRDQLFGNVLERLLEARVDIAANEALAQHLEGQLKGVPLDESTEQQFKTQREALRKKLSLLSTSAKRIQELNQGRTSASMERDLLMSQVEIQSVEAELAKLVADEEASERRRAAEVAAPLADVRVELYQLKARERMSELQLKALATAANADRERRKIQREVDRLNERLDLCTRRGDEIAMETAEAKVLLREIEDAIKNSEANSESDRSTD